MINKHFSKAVFVVVFAVLLLLCSCTEAGLDADNNTTSSNNDEVYTAPKDNSEVSSIANGSTESTSQFSETTDPLHSEIYLSKYSPQQILEYFKEVVLDMEYSDGLGNTAIVQKWNQPLNYRLYGTYTKEDTDVLNALFDELNKISGFPGIYAAEDGVQENLSISFLESEEFSETFTDILNGEEANGATQFWYYTETNEIHTARIGYRTDIDQATRNSILIEEVINMLGISDTVLRTDSIVYQYSDENTELSDVDWVIFKLLYNPAIQCGMDYDKCAAIVKELYY